MFHCDFLKGQILKRCSTISSLSTKTSNQTNTHSLTDPSSSCHSHSFHHVVTQTWVPEDGQTCVSLHHQSTCHPAFYLDKLCLKDHKPWPRLPTGNIDGIWVCTIWSRPITFLWLLSNVGNRWGRRGKESCRVEVKWAHWVREPPLALKLWRGLCRKRV